MRGVSEARFGSLVARGVAAVSHDVDDLTSGFWVVVVTFEGHLTAVRMDDVRRPGCRPPPQVRRPPRAGPPSRGRGARAWTARPTSRGSRRSARRIAAGTVYQVNLCRVLEHDLPDDARMARLGARLARGQPGTVRRDDRPPGGRPRGRLRVAGGLPRAPWRPGHVAADQGHRARPRDELLAKDYAENVMIVDLVRHDLGHVSLPGHRRGRPPLPGRGAPGPGAPRLRRVGHAARGARRGPTCSTASFPPGSVSGAPKHTALHAIADLEPVPRGPYCGAVGWVDADRDEAELAVGIRTFWAARDDGGAAGAAVRHGRRDHVGERRRGGVARDRAQGGASRGARHGRRRRDMRGCEA